jgi:hypothetical protein
MHQVARRQPGGRSRHCLSRHCLPRSAAVLAKQSHHADPEDRHLRSGRRFRRDEAAGVSRNSMLARRHRRVARRGRRPFLQNELICRNADESMGRVSPPRLARRASPVRFDSRVWRNKPNADGLRTASGILAERNTPENRSQIKVLRAPSRHGWCRAVKPAPGVLHPAGGEPPQAEAGLLGFAPDRIGRDLPCHHEGLTAAATSRRGGSAPLAAPSRA